MSTIAQLNTTTQWHKYLDQARGKSVEAILEFAGRMAEFAEHCEGVSGGSRYTELCKEWFDMSPAACSRWRTIGNSKDELFHQMEKLPPSETVIYQVTTMTDAQREKVTPTMTQRQATAIKRGAANPQRRVTKGNTDEQEEKFLKVVTSVPASVRSGLSELGTQAMDSLGNQLHTLVDEVNLATGKTIMTLLVAAVKHMQLEFKGQVTAEVRKQTAKKTAELDAREKQLNQRVVRPLAEVLTPAQVKQIQACLHPDTAATRTDAQLAKAFDAFRKAL